MLLRSSTPRLSPAVGILLVCGLFWGWGVVCGREREREGIYGSLVYYVTENAAEEGGDKGKII
jgi:hypothetical protein